MLRMLTIFAVLSSAAAVNAQVPQLQPASALGAYDASGKFLGTVHSLNFSSGEVVLAFEVPGSGTAVEDTVLIAYFWKRQRIRDFEWHAGYGGSDSVYFDQSDCRGRAYMQVGPSRAISPTSRYVAMTGGHFMFASNPNATVTSVGTGIFRSVASETGCSNLPSNGTYSCPSCVEVFSVGDLDLFFIPPFKLASLNPRRRAVSP